MTTDAFPEPILLNAGPSGFGWSPHGAFLHCPSEYAYKYVRKGAPSASEARVVGGGSEAQARGRAVHLVLAHHYRRLQAEQMGDDPNKWLDPYAAADAGARAGEYGMDHVPMACKMLDYYRAWWGEEKHTVIAVEEVWKAELGLLDVPGHPKHGEPIFYAPRVDLVTRDASGGVWFWDHKTTSVMKGDSVSGYSVHGQFIGMKHLGRAFFGADFKGVILNFIQTTPPPKFARPPLEAAPHADAQWPRNILRVRHEMAKLEAETWAGRLRADEWPKSLTETSCVGRYGKCSAFDWCSWGGA